MLFWYSLTTSCLFPVMIRVSPNKDKSLEEILLLMSL